MSAGICRFIFRHLALPGPAWPGLARFARQRVSALEPVYGRGSLYLSWRWEDLCRGFWDARKGEGKKGLPPAGRVKLDDEWAVGMGTRKKRRPATLFPTAAGAVSTAAEAAAAATTAD